MLARPRCVSFCMHSCACQKIFNHERRNCVNKPEEEHRLSGTAVSGLELHFLTLDSDSHTPVQPSSVPLPLPLNSFFFPARSPVACHTVEASDPPPHTHRAISNLCRKGWGLTYPLYPQWEVGGPYHVQVSIAPVCS